MRECLWVSLLLLLAGSCVNTRPPCGSASLAGLAERCGVKGRGFVFLTLQVGSRSEVALEMLMRVVQDRPVTLVACHEMGQIEVVVASAFAAEFVQIFVDLFPETAVAVR